MLFSQLVFSLLLRSLAPCLFYGRILLCNIKLIDYHEIVDFLVIFYICLHGIVFFIGLVIFALKLFYFAWFSGIELKKHFIMNS